MGSCVTGITKINCRGTGKRKSGNNVTITVDGTAESSAGRRLSHVLIPGTPARFGTPAVKAAPSKRRNSPEFTCRRHVCVYRYMCVEESLFQLAGNYSQRNHPRIFHSLLCFRASGVFMFTCRREIWMMLAARYAPSLG